MGLGSFYTSMILGRICENIEKPFIYFKDLFILKKWLNDGHDSISNVK